VSTGCAVAVKRLPPRLAPVVTATALNTTVSGSESTRRLPAMLEPVYHPQSESEGCLAPLSGSRVRFACLVPTVWFRMSDSR
jgi:hypothetical protein